MVHQALDGYTSSGALLPPSHPDVQLVRRLGAAVVRAALEGLGGGAAAERLRGLRWEFNVVTDASKGDCYVTAGGKVRCGGGRVGTCSSTYQPERIRHQVLFGTPFTVPYRYSVRFRGVAYVLPTHSGRPGRLKCPSCTGVGEHTPAGQLRPRRGHRGRGTGT